MSVTLPTTVRPSHAKLYLRRAGRDLTPANLGPVQRLARLGTRFAADLVYPPMTKVQAEALIGALVDVDTQGTTLVVELPMGPLAASLGTPLVNGASQSGSTLNADGFTASVAIPVGTPFSVVASSRNWLHMTRQAISANGSGVAALPIGPMLRASPADNAALTFAAPKLEGFIDGNELPWDVDTAMLYGLAFTVFENE